MPSPSTKPGAKLDRARQEFEILLAKLAEARRMHARWEASAVRLRELGRRTLEPLEEQFNVYARQLIKVFDQAYGHSTLNDSERVAIAESICTLANRMLNTSGDNEIQQFFDRYSSSEYGVNRMHFGPVLREIGDMLLADTYPMSLSWNEEEDQEQAEELHAKLVRVILTMPPEQQPALLEQADAGYINGDPVALRVLEIEMEQGRRPGSAHLGRKQIEQSIEALEDYLIDVEFDTVGIQFSLMVKLNLPATTQLTEYVARQCVRMQKHLLEHQLENIACDVADFRDIAKLKAWLKEKQRNTESAAPTHH
ncbi:hypothetical protein [Pseudoduganella aquatica]|uniref:Uncharacterized protein n=1 Tax=Pseudoduganella aquatica TaxID=2660641 RepID=A0A7X4HGG1_9BURK|nr:hypothetical protein [Pseudoduganella aquatica]MYN10072.1 hypothetical protein [Pseudoduganella aquatica]